MSKVTISCRENGPFLVEGEVTLLDPKGQAFPLNAGKPIALCRCGASKNRPFCDGSHKACGFASAESAPSE